MQPAIGFKGRGKKQLHNAAFSLWPFQKYYLKTTTA